MSEAQGLIKRFGIHGKNFVIVKMDPFNAIHFQLRIMELLAKHQVNVSGSLIEAAGRLFAVLNRADHDEILFSVLEKSRAQCTDNSQFLNSWGEVNVTFTAEDVADVYLVALECVKFSILPVLNGLKKNTGLDMAASLPGNMRELLTVVQKILMKPSAPASPSGE